MSSSIPSTPIVSSTPPTTFPIDISDLPIDSSHITSPLDFPTSPVHIAQSDAARNASHHELKLPGYHLYETKYSSPFLLQQSLPPGSKLYTGPRKFDDGEFRQVGFLVIPPAFHPHEVALDIEMNTAKQFANTQFEHYTFTDSSSSIKDFTGVLQTTRITPLQPLVSLNVPTTVHGKNLPNTVTDFFNPLPVFAFTAGAFATTAFIANHNMHKSFQGLMASSIESPQQYASRLMNLMKTNLVKSAQGIQLTMPLFEIGLTATAVCALLNRYRTKSIVDSEFKRVKDAENKLQLAPSVVSPLVITHSDPDYNIHPSAMAFLGDIKYHPDLGDEELPRQTKLENDYILSNVGHMHSALCNVALDVPQPLPTTTNLLFDCFDSNGDLVKAFTGETINSDRAQGEYLKIAKTRQRESKILQHLPLIFSQIPNSAYQGFAALLGVTWGVTKISHGLQKYLLNYTINRGTMVLRNSFLSSQFNTASIQLPPTFLNQVVYSQQSSVLFPALAKLKPIIAFRVFITGLFTAYFYKIIEQASIIANTPQHQQFKARAVVTHQKVPRQFLKKYHRMMMSEIPINSNDKIIYGSLLPSDDLQRKDFITQKRYTLLEMIHLSRQRSTGESFWDEINNDPTPIVQEILLRSPVRHDDTNFERSGNAVLVPNSDLTAELNGQNRKNQNAMNAIANEREIPHLSIESKEAKEYPQMLEKLIPDICSSSRPAIATKLLDEWLPVRPNDEVINQNIKKFTNFFDQVEQNGDKISEYYVTQEYSNLDVDVNTNDDFEDPVEYQDTDYGLSPSDDDNITTSGPKIKRSQISSDSLDTKKTDGKDDVAVDNTAQKSDIITRTYWFIDTPPLPSALITQPIQQNNTLNSWYSALTGLLSRGLKNESTTQKSSLEKSSLEEQNPSPNNPTQAPTSEDAQEKQNKTKEMYGAATHDQKRCATKISPLSNALNIFAPLDFFKPILPSTDDLFIQQPQKADLQSSMESSTRFRGFNPYAGEIKYSNEEFNKDGNIPFITLANKTINSLFHIILASAIVSVPVLLTSFEYYHQKNLSYMTHTYGIPAVSELATPGMVSTTQVTTSLHPSWLLTKGMKHNSKYIFALYNVLSAIKSTTRQTLTLLKSSLGSVGEKTPTLPATTPNGELKMNFGIFGKASSVDIPKKHHPFLPTHVPESFRLMKTLPLFALKFAIPYFLILAILEECGQNTVTSVLRATTPTFSDGRNGVTTDALLLDNKALVYFDKQSAHNIKLRNHLQEEKRKQREKREEKETKQDIEKFGPQQTVKRLFDNAIKRDKQQAKQEDVKKREEEFEAKLDENGELKLTRKQRLVRFFAYCENIVRNAIFIEPKSCEKKFAINPHNTQGAINSSGVMLVLLQEHLRKQFITQLQEKYDKEYELEVKKAKEAHEKRIEAELQKQEDEKNNHLNNFFKVEDTTSNTTETNTEFVPPKEKKIEDDPGYPKQVEKPPNFRFMHVLQKSNIFMLLDQQNIHNEYEYVYHILHKKFLHDAVEQYNKTNHVMDRENDQVEKIVQNNLDEDALLNTTTTEITTSTTDDTATTTAPIDAQVTTVETVKDNKDEKEDHDVSDGQKHQSQQQPQKVVLGGATKKPPTTAELVANTPTGLVDVDSRVYTGVPLYYVTSPL